MILKRTKHNLAKTKSFIYKYRGIFIIIFIAYALWFFGLGVVGGWLLSKGSLSDFPTLTENDRILILAPHIDDEILGAGGLVQEAITQKAQVKIIYMTNGDNNLGSTIEDETGDINFGKFVELGEKRMKEGKASTKALGLKESDTIFLGYPDKGLTPMLTNHYTANPYVSRGTRFNFNPYKETFREKQEYLGLNVTEDLQKIIGDFKPDIVITSHPRDKHPDHRSTYYFLEKALANNSSQTKVYAYLVHYSLYPPVKKLDMGGFLYPPKNLFAKEGWFSFNLSSEQEDKKLEALKKNQSQFNSVALGNFAGFLQSFVKENELFELMD